MLQVSDTDPDQRNLNHLDDYFLLTNTSFITQLCKYLKSKLKFKLRLRKFLAEHRAIRVAKPFALLRHEYLVHIWRTHQKTKETRDMRNMQSKASASLFTFHFLKHFIKTCAAQNYENCSTSKHKSRE